MRALALLLLLAPLSPACAVYDAFLTCNEDRWGYDSPREFDRYVVTSTVLTPHGVRLDASGTAADPRVLDAATDAVEACLGMTIDRGSFRVKVAADWVWSCNTPYYGGLQQELPVAAPAAACVAKGLTPTSQCQCLWRAGIACPDVIVTPPSFYVYPDALVRFVTGTTDPWVDVPMCAGPYTSPIPT